jgi:hypothetical protein
MPRSCVAFPACVRPGCGRPACDHEDLAPHLIMDGENVVCAGHWWDPSVPIPPEFQGGGGSGGGGGASGNW